MPGWRCSPTLWGAISVFPPLPLLPSPPRPLLGASDCSRRYPPRRGGTPSPFKSSPAARRGRGGSTGGEGELHHRDRRAPAIQRPPIGRGAGLKVGKRHSLDVRGRAGRRVSCSRRPVTSPFGGDLGRGGRGGGCRRRHTAGTGDGLV